VASCILRYMSNSDPDPHHEPPADQWPPPGAGLWLWLTLAVSVGIILVQLFPFTFGQPTGPMFSFTRPPLWLLIVQVLLFMPLGVVEGELARRVLGGLRAGHWGAALVGVDAALLALLCETMQYWVAARPSTLVDVLAAAFGGVLGYMLATLWRGHPG